jgi:HAD superfamily hydrolase (TIGR01509 family)
LSPLVPPHLRGVEAVVFDLDGTLLDSERAIVHSVSRALLDLDVQVPHHDVEPHLGAPLEELYSTFVGDDDHVRRQRFIALYIDHHDQHPERHPAPLPGVVPALQGLFALGLPMAVATTKPTGRAAAQLTAAGLLPFFGHVQGTDPPLRPKPHPDVVFAACKALEVDPARSIMVGDTSRDIGAAHAAGARAVLVTYSAQQKRRAGFMGADLVLESLEDLLERE